MQYVVTNLKPKTYQLSFEDVLFKTEEDFNFNPKDTHDTLTLLYKDEVPVRIKNTFNPDAILWLKNFNSAYGHLLVDDMSTNYHSFQIPKKSGGFRRIDAPNDELMNALRSLKDVFEHIMPIYYHTAAFAYIRGRSISDAVKRHQENESWWFLKLDFHNFFGSTTKDFVTRMFSMIYPFSEILKDPTGKEEFDKALSLCFLNGGLPQGTPISPLITNIMMIPIDHAIKNRVAKKYRMVYTRYADDMHLSSKYDFKWMDVQSELIAVINEFRAPFNINREKTHYGSRNGRNWILGQMLNKDNKITIGYKRKKQFKSMIMNFINDCKTGNTWSIGDVQSLQGIISYYSMVEGDSIKQIVNEYSKKYSIDVMAEIKSILAA